MPRVTVIIPTFNYAQVLPYSIGSVLGQTFGDFELLVIGDHCTDESESVVRAIGDPRVRWINLPKNIGHQSGPNNEGLRQARGELVAYLGHDDLWLPVHLALAVGAIDAGADLTFALTEMVWPGDETPTFEPQDLGYHPGLWIPPTSVVHRRDAWIRVGDWRHYRDVPDKDPEADLWQRMHRAGYRIQFVRRLTAIKFPAGLRKGVYADKPSHEQSAWSARIRNDPDFAAIELARMLISISDEITPFRESARAFIADVALRLRKRFWRLGLHKPVAKMSRSEVFEERLRFKGIGPRE